jgi:hypothetical protein
MASFVQSAAVANATTLAFPSSVTAGNLLLAYLTYWNGTVPSSLSDTKGNTWYLFWSNSGGASTSSLFVAIANGSGANTVTAIGMNNSNAGWIVEEYSIASTDAIILLGQTTGTGNSITLASSSTATPSGALVISFAYDIHSAHTWTSSNATIRQSITMPGAESAVAGDHVVASAISFASPYTNSYSGASGSGYLTGGLIAIVPTGGSGGTVPVPVAANLRGGVTGTAYSETVTAQGGTSPYTFAVSGGALPTGLSMSSGGAVSGTPTATGTSTFTITVTDSTSATGSQAFSITIAPRPRVNFSFVA